MTGRFTGKFVVKRVLKIPPHLAYVATLPCETLTLAKQTINDKLQGSVATYSSCGGFINNHERFIVDDFYTVEYLSKLQARAWLSHALCALGQQTAKR